MKPVLIFRHVDCEGPGYLQSFLNARRIPTRLIRIDAGEAVPDDSALAAGLVFMGGPMSVNDDLAWIHAELSLIRAALEQGIPVLGHCLGGQLIARALDAEVGPNPVREIGWHPVWQTDRPEAVEWFGEMEEPLEAFHWHGETFTMPAGAAPLLSSRFCPNQAFALDRVLAMQCHIEMTAAMVREWASRYVDQLQSPSGSVQTEVEMLADLQGRVRRLNALADRVYTRWIENLR
jgi:GMP synthase-like glutamine amidotransferase